MISCTSRCLHILYQLNQNGVATTYLVFIYTTYNYPLLESGAPVWSHSLTMRQFTDIERVQRRAFRMIAFSERHHYVDLLWAWTVTSIAARRIDVEYSYSCVHLWNSQQNKVQCYCFARSPHSLQSALHRQTELSCAACGCCSLHHFLGAWLWLGQCRTLHIFCTIIECFQLFNL